jgi:hypothetical protein
MVVGVFSQPAGIWENLPGIENTNILYVSILDYFFGKVFASYFVILSILASRFISILFVSLQGLHHSEDIFSVYCTFSNPPLCTKLLEVQNILNILDDSFN